MARSLYIIITSTNYCYGIKSFEIGPICKIVKEKTNEYDQEAVRAELPFIGKSAMWPTAPILWLKGQSAQAVVSMIR